VRSRKVLIGIIASSPIFVSTAIAQGASTNPVSTPMWVTLVAASIGAVAAIVTPFIKDFLVQIWIDRRSKRISEQQVFRNYLAPLADSTQKLLWRFNEIFVDHRHQWLKLATRPIDYNEYKRQSTLYRIATFLGWVRALNLELNALPRGRSGMVSPISAAIDNVRSALADGPHVELRRLERVCEIWHIDLMTTSELQKRKLATGLEVKLYALAKIDVRDDRTFLNKLERDRKFGLCKPLCDFICSELKVQAPSDSVISESLNAACEGLSYRESWIYRDWQDAIGESVLEPDPESVRRFRIVGYAKFETVSRSQLPWIHALTNCIVDVDFECADPNDFRTKQLLDFAKAIGKLALAISDGAEADLIDKSALQVARKLLAVT